MRILKYIFLLVVLAFIATAVFVATQKGGYEVTRSKIISSPREVVFSYVNEYRNWENWVTWNESGTNFVYPAFTSGKDASFSWSDITSEGKARTISVTENSEIVQELDLDGVHTESRWTFKD